MPSDAVFQAGELIGGRYRLRRLVGVGGMGAVWRVHNEATDRDVAIKFMLPELAKTPAQLQRFFQEAKALGRVRHRSIVEVYDLGRIEQLEGAPAEPRAGTPYLVMELLDGEPLDAILRRLRRLPLRAALELGAAISRGLQAAHASWIVHRDLKPANIFLHRERDGSIVPKILDFGVSKLLSPSRVVTSSGVVVGSPGYMSPEQAAGDVDIDARSDLWSLGVILYHCLTGRQPFREQNYNATMLAIVMTEPPALESLVEVPPAVAAIVRRCLQKRRDERFASAETLIDALQAALALLPAGDGLDSLASTSASATAPPEPARSPHTMAHDTEVRAPAFTAVHDVAPGELPKTVEMAAPPRPRRVPRAAVAVAVAVLALVVAVAVWPRRSPPGPTTPAAIGSTSVDSTSAPSATAPPTPATAASAVSVAAPAPSPPGKKLSKAVTPKAAKPATTGKQSEGVLDPGLP